MPSQTHIPVSGDRVDLLSIEAQLTELERQKVLLTAELLSFRSTLPISAILSQAKVKLSYDDVESPVNSGIESGSGSGTGGEEYTDGDIFEVVSQARSSGKDRLKKLYRMTGVTTFTAKDPSPPHGTNVGIRFDTFGDRKFTKKNYIILTLTANSYKVARHTIPAFIKVHELRARFPHDISRFARALRTKLQLYAQRLEAVQRLERTMTSMGCIGNVQEAWTNRIESVEWDLPVRIIVINWSIGARGSLILDERGSIEAAVVKDAEGERIKRLEVIIKSGNLDGVGVRLGYVMEREEVYDESDEQ